MKRDVIHRLRCTFVLLGRENFGAAVQRVSGYPGSYRSHFPAWMPTIRQFVQERQRGG
ncbi:MAG TPA: hypothetical protein P5013_08415 [Methanoregula sp.]|nr:hypothetical protein [Methanoregula sp.]